MQEIIIRTDLDNKKLEALLRVLNSWEHTEIVSSNIISEATTSSIDSTLQIGLWKDYNVDAKTLRNNVWKVRL